MLGGRVRHVPVERHTDERGSLVPLDFAAIPMVVRRAFVVTAPTGTSRGGHAHRRGRQVLMRLSGTIRVELATAHERLSVTLTEDSPAVLVEPGVWARQTYLGPDPSLAVFCDTDYDPGDYVHEVPAPADAR